MDPSYVDQFEHLAEEQPGADRFPVTTPIDLQEVRRTDRALVRGTEPVGHLD